MIQDLTIELWGKINSSLKQTNFEKCKTLSINVTVLRENAKEFKLDLKLQIYNIK